MIYAPMFLVPTEFVCSLNLHFGLWCPWLLLIKTNLHFLVHCPAILKHLQIRTSLFGRRYFIKGKLCQCQKLIFFHLSLISEPTLLLSVFSKGMQDTMIQDAEYKLRKSDFNSLIHKSKCNSLVDQQQESKDRSYI